MAKIDTSPKNGSVGWSTFVSGPYGLIEKQRARPRNPRTLAQQFIRSQVAAYATGWRELSEAQRAGWRALAGQLPGPLGGCQVYIKLNVTRSNCGLPPLVEAPPPPAFGILVCTGLVVEASADASYWHTRCHGWLARFKTAAPAGERPSVVLRRRSP